jgi:hypothetical protein
MDWMASLHARLGLGETPRAPLVEYLTRSASLLYALHGCVLLAASLDVRHNAPVVCAIGWLTAAFGLGMFGVDLDAGMPWYWTAFEGLPTAAAGLSSRCSHGVSQNPPRRPASGHSSPVDSRECGVHW